MSQADRPVCEGADDAFLPSDVDPGPCSTSCPKHGRGSYIGGRKPGDDVHFQPGR